MLAQLSDANLREKECIWKTRFFSPIFIFDQNDSFQRKSNGFSSVVELIQQ